MSPWGSRHRDGHGFRPFFSLFLPLFAVSLVIVRIVGNP